MKKQCQSCGMPLQEKDGDSRGIEADGSKSEKYCSLYYENGKFIDEDCALERITKTESSSLRAS